MLFVKGGLLAAVVALAGCATGTVVVLREERITAPKVISLDAPLEPWVAQIEKRLRQQGFQVKRISRNSTGALADLGSRYVLRIGGAHYRGWERRCFGGGYKFHELTAELYDLDANESIASVAGEGYSEDCPPASGSIFGDIAKMVTDRWK